MNICYYLKGVNNYYYFIGSLIILNNKSLWRFFEKGSRRNIIENMWDGSMKPPDGPPGGSLDGLNNISLWQFFEGGQEEIILRT